MITLALYIVALILFVLAAIPIPSRVALGWLGAACATLALIVDKWPG